MSSHERRRDPRALWPTTVTYRLLDIPDDLWRTATVGNLSAGGTRLRTAQTLTLGTRVELEVVLPDRAEPYHIRGEVVWVKASPKGVQEYGLTFVDLTPERQFDIDQLVQFLMRRRVPRWPV